MSEHGCCCDCFICKIGKTLGIIDDRKHKTVVKRKAAKKKVGKKK